MDRRDLGVGPHILQEGGLNLLPEAPLAQKLSPVQIAQRAAELEKFAQTLDGDPPLEPHGLRHAQRVDDDRRIPEPVKEIVGVGIVSGEDRRGHHRSPPRNDVLSETGPLLDQMRGRDCEQHRARREERFLFYPVVKRSHATAGA